MGSTGLSTQERASLGPLQAQAQARLTCIIESKEHWAGDGEGQDPDDGNHDGDPALGAVACVVQHGHGYRCVPVRGAEAGVQVHRMHTQEMPPPRD